ncbi:MAG: leucyl aminopeptidase [Pseudomonadota bacterium]
MKQTRIVLTQKPEWSLNSDLLVYCLPLEKNGKLPRTNWILKKPLQKAYDLKDFSGKTDEMLLFYPSCAATEKQIRAKRILVMGMGETGKDDETFEVCEMLRQIGGEIAKICEKIKVKTVTICLPSIKTPGIKKTAQALIEGVLLGDYRFLKYKKTTQKKTDYTGLDTIRLACEKSTKDIRRGMSLGSTAAFAACKARDMANEPGNGWTSVEFAEYAKTIAKKYDLIYSCLEKEDMEKSGMGGILAVNQGSAIPPKMVILEYWSKKKTAKNKTETLLLVGKGITFDSGGISIKPAAGMEEMKYDMCGGAAVLTVMQVVGEEQPDLNVVAIVPATDNMSGSSAVRPGDIIHHFNGVTSEIVNTDAEGRMILADALAYGIKTFSPDGVVDIATLTGAVIIGLGHHHSGLMSNNDVFSDCLIQAGKEAGEPIWRLPLTKEYIKQIESKVADIKNVGGRPAGSITAAAYLSKFVGDTPWAHLDIAGTAWDYTEKSYIPKGPSGICVRTFIALIRNWKKGMIK